MFPGNQFKQEKIYICTYKNIKSDTQIAISRALTLDQQSGHLDHHLQRPTVQVTKYETLKKT
jgi:hypothetical protein